jgi:hypothetical protein
MRLLRKKADVCGKVALPPRKAGAIRRAIVCKFSAGIAAGWKFGMATEDAGPEFAWKRTKAVRKITMCNVGEPRRTGIPPIIASGGKSVLESRAE